MRTVLLLITLSVLLAAVVLRQGGAALPAAAVPVTAPAPRAPDSAPDAADGAGGEGRLWSWRSADGVRHLSTLPPPPGTPASVSLFARPPPATAPAADPSLAAPAADAALQMAAGATAAARLIEERQQALEAQRNTLPAR